MTFAVLLGWARGTFYVFIDDGDFDGLLRAVKRLALNDAAIEWEREQSPALGMGLRMGFLGVLHMEVGRCVIARVLCEKKTIVSGM